MRKTISTCVFFGLLLISGIMWVISPDSKLNDYRMELTYTDGQKETYDIDSVASFRTEAHRVGYKVQYWYYKNGAYDANTIFYVIRYKLYQKRPPYKNDTASFRNFKAVQYSLLGLMAISALLIFYKPKRNS